MTTAAGAEALPDKGPLERILAPIADVRRGEALSALLMAATMFLILYAYYLLKPRAKSSSCPRAVRR